MDFISWDLVFIMAAGLLWVTGSLLQWSNLRRQDRLLARLRRMAGRRVPRRFAREASVWKQTELAESLRPSKRSTVR